MNTSPYEDQSFQLEMLGFLSIRLIHNANNALSSITANAQLAHDSMDDIDEVIDSLHAIEKCVSRFSKELSIISQYRKMFSIQLIHTKLKDLLELILDFCRVNGIFVSGDCTLEKFDEMKIEYSSHCFSAILNCLYDQVHSVHLQNNLVEYTNMSFQYLIEFQLNSDADKIQYRDATLMIVEEIVKLMKMRFVYTQSQITNSIFIYIDIFFDES